MQAGVGGLCSGEQGGVEAQTRASLWRGLGVAGRSLRKRGSAAGGAGTAPRPGGPLPELGVQRHLGGVPTRPSAGALADPGLPSTLLQESRLPLPTAGVYRLGRGSPSQLEPSLVPRGRPSSWGACPPWSGVSCVRPHARSWDPRAGQAGALVPPLSPALGTLPAPSRLQNLPAPRPWPPVTTGDGHSRPSCAPLSPWDSVGASSSRQ